MSQYDLSAPAANGATYTSTNTQDADFSALSRMIYVPIQGNVQLVMQGGQTVTFSTVPAGTTLPVRASGSLAAGTTVTSLVVLW
jgi:effector-binding domain-containing protein